MLYKGITDKLINMNGGLSIMEKYNKRRLIRYYGKQRILSRVKLTQAFIRLYPCNALYQVFKLIHIKKGWKSIQKI